MKTGNLLLSILSTLVILKAEKLSAVVLPEERPLRRVVGNQPIDIDPALLKWFKKYQYPTDVMQMDLNAFKKITGKIKDPIEKSFLSLRYANAKLLDVKPYVEDAEKNLAESIIKAREEENHVLLGPLYAELINSRQLEATKRSEYLAKFMDLPGALCSSREMALGRVLESSAKKVPWDSDEMKLLLGKIAETKSSRFRERSLEQIIANSRMLEIPIDERLFKSLFPAEWDAIRQRLLSESDTSDESSKKNSLPRLTDYLKKSQCEDAAKDYKDALEKNSIGLGEFKDLGNKISNCFKGKGQNPSRYDFWKDIDAALGEKYGFDGFEFVKRSLGSSLWALDNHAEAIKIFDVIVAKAKSAGNSSAAGEALFNLAKIQENDDQIADAIKTYRMIIDEFKDHPKAEEAIIAFTVLNFQNKEYQHPKSVLQKFIDDQSKLNLDERSAGTYSFALFWLGRIHWISNNKQDARFLWKKLASEYYSSFYGALAHLMLEKIKNRQFAIGPAKTPSFSEEKLLKSVAEEFAPPLKRALFFLNYGFKREASCELSEFETGVDAQERSLLKAMLLHASGSWLDAIKIFDGLPRSFRMSLPLGFERILFPVDYDQLVLNYAAKNGIDPSFIFGIIRQESVFNPAARSPVGATGLMQLMPATAKLEFKAIPKDARNGFMGDLKKGDVFNPEILLRPEINIALGVHHVRRLINKYKSPLFVLTSYNANPAATERWMKNIDTEDFLVFMERIPYNETRMYVKLVMRNYFYYQRWYLGPKSSQSYFNPIIKSVLNR